MFRCRRAISGFTLVELLVVVAILSMLAAILYPVFAQARQKGRQAVCLSNQRQIGIAFLLYAHDYDDTFPNGFNVNGTSRIWPGEGWAGQCLPYVHQAGLFRCPSDKTLGSRPFESPVSYAYNINFVGYLDEEDELPPPGRMFSELTDSSRSILLFEVAHVTVNLGDAAEGANSPDSLGQNFSPSGNGLDNRLYAQETWQTSIENQYATGYLGGRLPPDLAATQFADVQGRHASGANYLLGDGHTRWFRGENVSSGLNALGEDCPQDNIPFRPGCGMVFHAAGTQSAFKSHRATFSIK